MKDRLKKMLLKHPKQLLQLGYTMADIVSMFHATILIHRHIKGVKANG